MSTRDPAMARRIISLIDLTDLRDDHDPSGIGPLLEQARRHRTAAVCVWPEYVGRSAEFLSGSSVRVATVADFPGGDADASSVIDEITRSLDDGADEIDLVLPYRAVLAGDTERAASSVSTVADLVHGRGAILKVILETGELADSSVISEASRLAVASGADFLKTSTGKTAVGASLMAVDAMIDQVLAADRAIGLKPSGGISTVEAAAEYVELVERRLGAEATRPERLRFGASSLLGDALAAVDR